jgi:small subunit ribosomal protein S20
MAHHKSALKRIRQTEVKTEHNRYFAKTTRNAIKSLRSIKEKAVAAEMLPKVSSMLDKLAKKNIIHSSKASNLKSGLAKHVNGL